MNLGTVEILKDSEFERIEKHAFSETPIKKIIIPRHLKHICRSAFYKYNEFKKVILKSLM